MNQFKTPLYDALKEHHRDHPLSLHVPGHKGGGIFHRKGNPYFQQILNIDVTELSGLDDLHSPEGVILEAEDLLAKSYKVDRSFFLVNGSTVGNLAMIMGTLGEGDFVLVQRNCHKSVLNGIQLVKANPVLLGPELYEEWGIAGGISLETIKQAYELYPGCKAIILTYPNYYGMTMELESIIGFAHEHHIPVLVDEAHGAHFIGGDYFPPSAVELGADVIVQSAHKTLPAMTMGSFLHVNSRFVSVGSINHYLRILQSSSPSYPIMASLDLARSYIATYTKEDEQFLKESIDAFLMELNKLDSIRVLAYPMGVLGDPLKVTLQSTTSLSGFQLQSLFEKEGIYTELADPYNVLLVLPLLKKDMFFPFGEIIARCKTALSKIKLPTSIKKPLFFQKEKISTLQLQSCRKPKEGVAPIGQSKGYVSAETIIPYPPGVPILLRGEKITSEDVHSLQILIDSGAKFQGGHSIKKSEVKVLLDLEDTDE